MKDLSFFLIKNSLGAKMKKSFRSFCNGVGSTSTLNQNKVDECDSSCMVTPSVVNSDSPPTLEEMILQLELEEEATRKAKLDGFDESRRRMSCVNNSDILRSARNALNQYPRFSVDGRDAMIRSSFRNLAPFVNRGGHKGGRSSVCCSSGLRLGEKLFTDNGFDLDFEIRTLGLPATIAGESVAWCKPGVVAKLMGLEAIPVPTGSNHRKEKIINLSFSSIRRENLRRAERQELERRRLLIGTSSGCSCRTRLGRGSTTGYCVMKPIAVEPTGGQRGLGG